MSKAFCFDCELNFIQFRNEFRKKHTQGLIDLLIEEFGSSSAVSKSLIVLPFRANKGIAESPSVHSTPRSAHPSEYCSNIGTSVVP